METGSTRKVFIFNNLVVKMPLIKKNCYRNFLKGLLANEREGRLYYQTKRSDLCPVVYYNKFGFILIQKRAKVLNNNINWNNFYEYINCKYKNDSLKEIMLSDLKPSNFGILNKKLVKIDYGD